MPQDCESSDNQRELREHQAFEEPDWTLPHSGDLAQHSFPNLLQRLYAARASGTLLLARGKKRKAVQFEDGYLVAVKSNLVSECFGNQLVRRGLLADDDFEQSLSQLRRGDERHGEILVRMDLLSEDMVRHALCAQAEEKLFELFEWTSGGFKFKPGACIHRGNELDVARSPTRVIVHGVWGRVPIESIDAFIHEHCGSYVVAGENLVERLPEIDLDSKQAELLRLVNGRRELGYFRTADPSLRRLLYGLILTRILELSDAAGSIAGPGEAMDWASSASATSTNPLNLPPNSSLNLPGDSLPSSVPPPRDWGNEELSRGELAAMVERLRDESYFEMFGISEDADEGALRSAYEDRAGRVHPERYEDASAVVRRLAKQAWEILSQAHETLLDVKRRSEYKLELRKRARMDALRIENEGRASAEVALEQGQFELRRRNPQRALVHFGKVLELNPERGDGHAYYGWCLFLCHQQDEVMIQEAIEHVQRGAKLARDWEKPYLFLGRLYKASGRMGAAKKMFARAVQIEPDCVDALRELRLINMRRQKDRGLLRGILPRRGPKKPM